MAISISTLRGDIYKLLDHVLETGQPLEIERKGNLLKIIPEQPRHKLAALIKHDCLVGDPETFIHLDWSEEWRDALP